ncbi:hypothetical protein [Nonomuraea jabiensis]|uniref:Uncharacterized protein n=1 Tax=Nonomuraea jabiensis TaxID=882448 RepID=A0A7W9FZH3_9ACTN|nr:hypothetical protein [Nonomuraea jabiensis]MBB5774408.1 hypothetical protein [Nonomuraea jabiensis]
MPGTNGRPPKHGGPFALSDPTTWPTPHLTTTTQTTRYGIATATCWDRLHPRPTHRAAWLDHQGDLPILEGTLIRLQVERLPGSAEPRPVWLWSSCTGLTTNQADLLWQAFLRRFDPDSRGVVYATRQPGVLGLRLATAQLISGYVG